MQIPGGSQMEGWKVWESSLSSQVSIYISAAELAAVFEYLTNVNNNEHHHQPHAEIATTLMVLSNKVGSQLIIIHIHSCWRIRNWNSQEFKENL